MLRHHFNHLSTLSIFTHSEKLSTFDKNTTIEKSEKYIWFALIFGGYILPTVRPRKTKILVNSHIFVKPISFSAYFDDALS